MKKAPHCSYWGIYPAFGWIVAGGLMIAKGRNVGIYGGDVEAGEVIGGIGIIWILIWFVMAFKKPN
jgi:hypothetical protein